MLLECKENKTGYLIPISFDKLPFEPKRAFFVTNKKFLNFIKGDRDILEKKPLEKVCKKRQLSAFKHHGFWKCMDTVRDRDVLIKILKKKVYYV